MSNDGQLFANEDGWSDWVVMYSNHVHTCCDCGLVHDVQYRRVHRGLVRERWRTNEKFTNRERGKWPQKKRELWLKFCITDLKTGPRLAPRDALLVAIAGLLLKAYMLCIQHAQSARVTASSETKR